MSSSFSKILGDVSLKDCAISALLVLVLVIPATCMILPHQSDDRIESIQN